MRLLLERPETKTFPRWGGRRRGDPDSQMPVKLEIYFLNFRYSCARIQYFCQMSKLFSTLDPKNFSTHDATHWIKDPASFHAWDRCPQLGRCWWNFRLSMCSKLEIKVFFIPHLHLTAVFCNLWQKQSQRCKCSFSHLKVIKNLSLGMHKEGQTLWPHLVIHTGEYCH